MADTERTDVIVLPIDLLREMVEEFDKKKSESRFVSISKRLLAVRMDYAMVPYEFRGE